ncbi:hypothetical protein [Actinopolymorpha pittospori]
MLISSVWREGSRWWFSAGLLAGGLTSSLVTVAIGVLLRPFLPRMVVVALVLLAFAAVTLIEFGAIRLRLPQNARQVPETIGDDGPRYGALHFGFEMGTGVRTYMTTGLPHVLALAVLVTAGWTAATTAGLAFGAGRAWMTLARHGHRDDGQWDQLLDRHERSLRALTTLAFGVAVASIVWTALHAT